LHNFIKLGFGIFVALTLASNQATAASVEDVLARLDKLEKKIDDLRSENAALRARVRAQDQDTSPRGVARGRELTRLEAAHPTVRSGVSASASYVTKARIADPPLGVSPSRTNWTGFLCRSQRIEPASVLSFV